MASEAPAVVFDDDNPEWTEADFARARPAADVLPAAVMSALVKNKGGRPSGSTKEQVSLRIDRDVLERFRAGGPGWQSRMNELLRGAVRQERSITSASRGQGTGALFGSIAI